MKNLELIKERYLREPFNRKLGHLASDLARISSFLDNSINIKAAEDVLEESKFFIEWTAPEAPSHLQALLSEMQSKLALWHRHLIQKQENSASVKELRKMTKVWSIQLVEFSGLIRA